MIRKTKSYSLKKRGMMIPLIILGIIVIVGFAYAFHQFRMAQIFMTDETARFYAATCVAEAGISCAINELGGNVTPWYTHTTKKNTATKSIDWDTAHSPNNSSIKKSPSLLASFGNVSGSGGTVKGVFAGNLGEFKLRCGKAAVDDNDNTKSSDESKMYYKIESIGKYLNTYVKISAVAEARDLSEYLVFDNDFLDMTLGLPGTYYPSAKNFFNIGTFYGKNFIFLGITPGGPSLEMDNMSDIITGSTGEIYVLDSSSSLNGTPLSRNTNSSKNLIAPAPGSYVPSVSALKRDPNWSASFDNVNGVLKDGGPGPKHGGGKDMPIMSSAKFKDKYKKLALAAGIYITASGSSAAGATVVSCTNLGQPNDNTNWFEFKNPYKERDGEPVDLKDLRYVDFGASINHETKDKNDTSKPEHDLQYFAGMERDSNIKDSTILNKLKDKNFNGVIYSEVPLRIRGNPPRDLVIACDKDVYICGDFNQSTDIMQNYADNKFLEYRKNPFTGKEYFLDEDKNYRNNNMSENKGLYRHRATIFSCAKIWYDYTRPDMAFENELKPFIEWYLTTALTCKPANVNTASGDLNSADMNKIYNKIMKLKGSGGNLSAVKVDDYTLDLTADADPLSVLGLAKTTPFNDSGSAGVTAFTTDPKAAHIIKFLSHNYFGGDDAKAKQFIIDTDSSNKLKIKNTSSPSTAPQEVNFVKAINDCASSGKLPVNVRTAMVDALFNEINKTKPKSLWGSGGAPGSGKSLVFKLFEKVGYDATRNPQPLNQFKDPANPVYDRLFLPEISVNARLISSDARNHIKGTSYWHIGHSVVAIYNELGNRDVAAADYYEYMPSTTAILRLMGAEIFLRETVFPPFMKGGVYNPNLRKKMYDIALTNFEDPQGLTNYGIISWHTEKTTESEYNSY